MELIHSLVLVVNVVSALAVIVLVLMQHGKGADMGAAFGSGSAGSLFGASGSANFLSRSTAVGATVFFATSLALVLMTSPKQSASLGVMDDVKQEAPAASAPAQSKIPE
ncbi:preprotein translocase subunit SecG [Chitiniphilus purpureus]|uniref:Protein-export membrane protein SecG n=1 Tax=Chitiniphilus purpureus TaxID=2981137 RepID=A0ABY6DKP3_9NEIS|nr:preprotein translocase subunit SecG [Chitiniphilus sp. CD1]UXY14808.1 preprotein translocase subunit SecG [Chitiniphilus sp. CD1]